MIDINLANIVTVGGISVLFWALMQWAMVQFNVQLPWMKS